MAKVNILGVDYDEHPGTDSKGQLKFELMYFTGTTWFVPDTTGPIYNTISTDVWVRISTTDVCLLDQGFHRKLEALVCQQPVNPINNPGYTFLCDIYANVIFSVFNTPAQTSVCTTLHGSKVVAPSGLDYFVYNTPPHITVHQFYSYITRVSQYVSDLTAKRIEKALALSPSCDCGAKSTFGAKDYDRSHSDWCTVGFKKSKVDLAKT